jgi:hypothetical protein
MNEAENEQWLYYRELRLSRLYSDYAQACMIVRDFEHGSIGKALVDKMRKLEAELPQPL